MNPTTAKKVIKKRTKLHSNKAIIQETPKQTVADELIYYIQRLDLEMIDLLLKDDRKYQGFSKSEFRSNLELAFNELINAGDTFLDKYPENCTSKTCTLKSGYFFKGNNSEKYFNLIGGFKS
jgi:hypothetical protein